MLFNAWYLHILYEWRIHPSLPFALSFHMAYIVNIQGSSAPLFLSLLRYESRTRCLAFLIPSKGQPNSRDLQYNVQCEGNWPSLPLSTLHVCVHLLFGAPVPHFSKTGQPMKPTHAGRALCDRYSSTVHLNALRRRSKQSKMEIFPHPTHQAAIADHRSPCQITRPC